MLGLGPYCLALVFGCCLFASSVEAAYRCYAEHPGFGEFIGYGSQEQQAYFDSYNGCQVFVPPLSAKGCIRASKRCDVIDRYWTCHYYNSATDRYYSANGEDKVQAKLLARLLCQRDSGEYVRHCHESYIKVCVETR